jgi:predicted  nucleic acid-binding Zn-ribbon protein
MQVSVCSILSELYSVDTSLRSLERRAVGREVDRPQAHLRQLHARRDAAMARLPQELASHYRRVCGGRSKPIAVVSGGHCSGCQLRVPSQMENAGRSGGGYFVCPHCQRILLLAEAGHGAER